MNTFKLSLVLCLSGVTPLVYATQSDSAAVKPAAPNSAWLAQAKAKYPLKTCVVSREEIGGSMGEGIDYVYQQAGKPDQLVRFCCKDCRKDFDKDPARYLKLIAEAASKK